MDTPARLRGATGIPRQAQTRKDFGRIQVLATGAERRITQFGVKYGV
ncbi:MAG: hypothetical protein HYU37_01430 [Acidobacteria bacterium]|nr:hypothetical protein [Acidobacteriota bacterium]